MLPKIKSGTAEEINKAFEKIEDKLLELENKMKWIKNEMVRS